ncbi:hypothetical protein BD311DRAFT_822465 [Dichomitus squalens]|uniref:Uncharacterized protein n=1 Tax=Dichomitus squalens TaxID=114155 RepID=A0A4Q9M6Z4_9APHY|nr:hypothetical protein BD311DRAFT_822465 [Dichomitus squalens]
MRNTLPLLSRPPAPHSSFSRAHSPVPPSDSPSSQQHMPTIRLISATPSAAGSAGDASTSFASSSFISVAPSSSPLAPKPASADAPKKRLVPKRSKLGLLGGSSKSKEKPSKDFSDVVRRVGGAPSTGRGGFEIYVDQNDDPELGEIVVIKKKKSRLGLDGMKWGALGETTNIPAAAKEQPAADNLLKVSKGDENQKWWSIGRGRKDSKGKEKEKEQKPPARSKTPEPSKPLESRNRFNSLDSGILLNSPASRPQKQGTVSSVKSLLEVPVVTTTPVDENAPASANGLLSADAAVPTGSIAVRAIRSMRSLARMASWAQLSNANEKEGNTGAANAPNETVTTKASKPSKESGEKKSKDKETKEKGEAKKKKKKDKEKPKEKENKAKEKQLEKEKDKMTNTIRCSGSSFEAGALSSQGSPAAATHLQPAEAARTLTARKKQSILGLGLPSTMRLSTVRDVSAGSTASSVGPSSGAGIPQAPQRLSVDSAHLIMNAQGRPSSILSSGSSLRPPSTISGISVDSTGRSARSSSSSVVSVRWDDAAIKSVKEMTRQERRTRREHDREKEREEKEDGKKTKRESRRSSESRRRTPISDIFPETQVGAQRQSTGSLSPPGSLADHPMVRIEEATADGHSPPTDDEKVDEGASLSETPVKRARARPVSEQMLGRPRPQAICENSEAMLSLLDAATNDLASLINRLDLEATPGSTTGTPLNLTPLQMQQANQESPLRRRAMLQRGSPLKGELRESTASIASLRPYAKSQSSADPPKIFIKPAHTQSKATQLVGQQIAPWNELDWKVSPRKPLVKPKPAAHLTHKRTLTPSPADAGPVFQPLRPANTKSKATLLASEPGVRSATPPVTAEVPAPSSRTFGSRPSKVGLKSSKGEEDVQPSPTPVFSRVGGHHRKGSSLVPMNSKGSMGSLRRLGVTITPEARKGLGLCGTLGSSTEPDVDPEDPDSDIPDELQVILSGQSDEENTRPLSPFDDTLSFRPPPSPGSPPKSALPVPEQPAEGQEKELPVFQAQLFDADANKAELDDGERSPTSPSEDDTKKSFDFTGELKKLNESGGSDRASFVEQLETAFKTPARIELEFDFAADSLLAPPVPPLPQNLRPAPAEDIPKSFSNFNETTSLYGGSDETGNRDSGMSQDQEHDISFMMRELEDQCRVYPPAKARSRQSSMQSKPSDGRLNREFKFGGKPVEQGSSTTTESDIVPLTLSDIIPPLSHSRAQSNSSIVEEDSSVLKSILAKAAEILPAEESRSRVNSIASSKLHSSSTQLDQTANTQGHSREPSAASFTGFESFDEVRRGFEFGPNRPAFYPPSQAVFRPQHGRDMSVFSIASVSSYGAVVNDGTQDPFGYAQEGPSRPPSMDDISISMSMSVDDTFSFIRRAKPRRRVDSDASSFYFQPSHMMHPYRRGHRRGPSAMSVSSNAHGPPVSLYNRSFGVHAHKRNDSNTSASSVALSYAMHGANGGRAAWASHTRDFSVDSIMSDYSERPMARPGLGDKMFDNAHGAPLSAISASPESTYSDEREEANRTSWDSIMDNETGRFTSAVEDSLFDKTGKRTSMSSESVFGIDPSFAQYARYLPSQQYRPLSIMSEQSVHSPVKEDDTMITMLGGGHVRRRSISSLVETSPCVRMERKQHTAHPGRILQFDMIEPPAKESPAKASRLVAQPSIASTSSFQFGGERMIKARQGLLERQSLEDSALIAQGEDLLNSLRERSIFSKPTSAGRSRSSTCTSASSGVDTPPLSSSDGSSVSGGSQSSIDIGHLNTLLTNASHPSSGVARARARARARGTGHRRRIDQARMSRSSVYETIEEEASVLASSPSTQRSTPQSLAKQAVNSSTMMNDSVYIVESDRDSVYSEYSDEHGITTLRRYYALRNEAQVTVDESKRMWMDTPFSLFALQSFHPPREPIAMQALLEHSQKNYGPLPSELRPHRVRSRTSSRPSPYPLRSMRSLTSPERTRSSPMQVFTDAPSKPFAASLHDQTVLREVQRNTNVDVPTPPPVLGEIKPFTPFNVELETSKQGKNAIGLPARPRVTSSTRRAALGWSKRTGKSSTQEFKENSAIIPTPSETLRINRPRPRGRPTPARVPVPAA